MLDSSSIGILRSSRTSSIFAQFGTGTRHIVDTPHDKIMARLDKVSQTEICQSVTSYNGQYQSTCLMVVIISVCASVRACALLNESRAMTDVQTRRE